MKRLCETIGVQGKRKLVREIGEFEKSGVKLQCLTEERERLLVQSSYREVEKTRVREIGIPLYIQCFYVRLFFYGTCYENFEKLFSLYFFSFQRSWELRT